MKKKETLGKISSDLLQKSTDDTHSAHEQMLESLTDWDRHIYECIHDNKDHFSDDFYIVVVTKKEPLMRNVLRNYFMARHSCPTPDYDQVVYKYEKKTDILNFLWVIPSKDTCLIMKEYSIQVDPEERQLLQFVLDFADGSLYQMAKRLNGEETNSIFIEE